MSAAQDSPPARPLLTVLRGEPTPEQLAALVAVLGSRAAAPAAADAEPPAPSPWARPVLRAPQAPGPGAWRASALPGPAGGLGGMLGR